MSISKKIIWWSGIFLTVILTRLPTLLYPLLDIDESDFFVQAHVWLNGGIPYVDFVEKKPPMIWLFYFFNNMTAVHWMAMVVIALTAVFIFLTAKELADEKTGLVAALLFAILQSCYDLNDFLSLLTETPMNLFSIVCLFFFLRRSYFISGIFLALACLSKQVAIALIPILFIIKIAGPAGDGAHTPSDLRRRGINPSPPPAIFSILSGFALPILLLSIYLKHLGAWDDFLMWTWQANASYMAAKVPLAERVLHGLEEYGKFFAATLPFWVLAIWQIRNVLKNVGGDGGSIPPEQKRVGVWAPPSAGPTFFNTLWLLFIFPMTALGWRFFPHYFQQFLPPLALLAALGLAQFPLKKTAWGLILATALALFFFHIHEVKSLPAKNFKERAIAQYLKDHSNPDDKLFVWGHNSDIYFYSERQPASRFIYCSYLINAAEGYETATAGNLSPLIIKARTLLFDDFAKHPPQWIVDMSGTKIRGYDKVPIETFPELAAILEKNYRLKTDVEGARLYHSQRLHSDVK